jgi:hypothetical protein
VVKLTDIAPELVSVMATSLYVPLTGAVAASRACKVPEAEPAVSGNVAVEAHTVPLLETSKPTGAVAVIAWDKLEPEIANVCTSDGLP